MKEITCKSLGSENCDFVAKGETADELKQQMIAHAMQDHPDFLNNMSEEEKAKKMKMLDDLANAA